MIKRLLLTLGLLLCLGEPALSTGCGTGTGTCFVTAAGGNWNTNGTWSDTDGGGSCACTPTTGDQVYLTSNSGNNTANANLTMGAFDANGFTGTFTHNAAITLTINGNDAGSLNGQALRMSAAMTYTKGNTSSSAFTTSHTSGTITVTSNGKIFGNFNVNSPGATVQLADAFRADGSTTSTTLTVTNGTFNANNQNIQVAYFASTNSNTRSITMGSGTWTLVGVNGSPWNTQTVTGLTLTANTSTIDHVATATLERSFTSGNGITFNNISVSSGNQYGFAFIGGSYTIANITVNSAVRQLNFSGGVTITLTGALSYNGVDLNNMNLLATSGDPANLTVSGANTMSWLIIDGINENGAGSITCNSCYDGGRNTNVVINNPPATGGVGIIGAMTTF